MADENTVLSQYVPGFRANLNLKPQQMTARILGAVDGELAYAEPGTMFNADDIGTSDPVEDDTRVGVTPDGFMDFTRRVGFFKPFKDAKWLDNVDKARELLDPTNKTMAAMMAGVWRARDAKIIAAFFGNAYEKPDDTSAPVAKAFPAGQIVASNDRTYVHQDEVVPAGNGAYGMSIGKLIHASLILDASELDDQEDTGNNERYLALSAKQRANLLQTTPATNQFYAEVKALQAGTINQFMGFKIIRTEKLTLNGGGERQCVAWIKRAMVYKGRAITNASIRIRHDRDDTPQAFFKAEHGAVRRYDTGVVEIDCAEV